MNRLLTLFILFLSLLAIPVHGYPHYDSNWNLVDSNESRSSRGNDCLNHLPQSTHIYSNGAGGYTWIESGDPGSSNVLDRIPRQHSIDPDGCGGFYYR